MHAKSVLHSEPHKVVDTTCPPLSKRKMIAHVQIGQGEGLMKDIFGKLIRAHRRKGSGKLQEDHFIDPCGFKVGKFLLRSGEKFKIDMRREDLYRMRFEGQYKRRSMRRSGRFDHRLQQRAMAKMVSVEIADRGDWTGTCALAG